MHIQRLSLIAAAIAITACATATTNVRPPLGAMLTSAAKTGAPVTLRFDPNAKVVMATAGHLPAATFLASQAEHGHQLYDNNCGLCHQPGQLVGPGFVEQWNDRRIGDFYQLVRSSMPVDNPGSMKDDEYLAIIAYLLQANHAPAGADSVKADTAFMRNHKIAVHNP